MEALNCVLFCTVGTSDKVYQMQLVEKDGGWQVLAQNGRRGSTLTPREKTKPGIPYEAARAVYDSTLKEKLRDGYTTCESGQTDYAVNTAAGERSGLVPHKIVDADDVHALIYDDRYVAQQKMDGQRLMAQVIDSVVVGSNKRGFITSISQAIHDGLTNQFNVVTDGEDMGDHYFVFDVLEFNGIDYSNIGFGDRSKLLNELNLGQNIHIVPVARTTAEKLALYNKVQEEGGEGLVFKLANEPSTVHYRHKFWNSLSAIVSQINEKASVGLMLLDDDGNEVHVGNVTIPSNKATPEVGTVHEIIYLYRVGENGSLFQPIYKEPRHDVTRAECLVSQVKYKPPMKLAA